MARPIRLPATSYRRSFFARRLNEMTGFGALLRALSPRRFAAVSDKSLVGYYVALVNYLGTLFPINDYAVMYAVEMYYEGDYYEGEYGEGEYSDEAALCEHLEHSGIPADLFGVELDYSGPESMTSPALALCRCFPRQTKTSIIKEPWTYKHYEVFDKHILRVLPPQDSLPAISLRMVCRPPRGREWQGVWKGLPEMVAYAYNRTGNCFLDYPPQVLFEGGGPAWDVDEIKALAKLWKQAKLMWRRIDALIQYIDQKPVERLPLLARVLMRDREIIDQITRRKKYGE